MCTHTTGSWPTAPGSWRAGAGRPWLVTVHATEYGRHQGWVDTYPQSHIHAAESEMVHLANHVITCSRYMRSHVAEVFGLGARRITVGLRFPSRDSAALQEILQSVLTDEPLRAQLVAEAREHVLRFDWDEVARRTAALYERQIAAHPGPIARATP